MEYKKILTLDDLYDFCKGNHVEHFSSATSGYQVSVQIPSTFELVEDNSHRGLLRLKIKVLHTGVNRNYTKISKKSAEAAKSSFAYRPVLAYIHQLSDGTWDFYSHNKEIVTDENGNTEFRYLEHQVGTITAEEPFFEKDKETGKEYLCAYAVIPEDYTKTAEIIRNKQGTKNSCELWIDEFSYSAGDNCLDLKKWYLTGTTLLGKDENGVSVEEAMMGSRADISDFSTENNSVVTYCSYDDQLINVLQKLDNTLSKFNISKKGGDGVLTKFDELLSVYGKTVEDVTFDYEGLPDEELEAKFAEVFGDSKIADNTLGGKDGSEGEGEDLEGSSSLDEANIPLCSEGKGEGSGDPVKTNCLDISLCLGEKKNFSLRLDDVVSRLYALINKTYGEPENAYYSVEAYSDGTLIMENWVACKYYRQNYVVENDACILQGDRIEVFPAWVTQEEKASLEALRNDYLVIKDELKTYKIKELFESDDYKGIASTEEFTQLKENTSDYSYEDLKSKLDGILLAYAKENLLTYSKENEHGVPRVGLIKPEATKKKSRYGNLFKNI